jgi:hypothetical protein
MVVEQKYPSLVQIMVFIKTRPTALEENITLAVIIHFYFIQCSVAGHFLKYSFTKLPTIHELYKFQREAPLLMALGASKSKKGEQILADDWSRMG